MKRLSELEPSSSNNFNLIRMLAAVGVLVSHAYPIALGPGTQEPLRQILGMSLGKLGVIVFFCISGFFIARSYDRNRSFSVFFVARALRLFPALMVVLLVTVTIAGFLTTAPPSEYWSKVPIYIMRNLSLIYLQYGLPGVFTSVPYGSAINGSLWTLFYEVICYALIAIAGLSGLFHRPKQSIFFTFVIIVMCITIIVTEFDLGIHIELLGMLALPFSIGTFLYLLRARILLSIQLAVFLLAASFLFIGTIAFETVFIIALCYAIFCLGYARSKHLLHYNQLGDYSYGFYIYAFPIQQLGAMLGYTTPITNMLFAVPFTIFCAVLSWHLVEAPALRYKIKAPKKKFDEVLKFR